MTDQKNERPFGSVDSVRTVAEQIQSGWPEQAKFKANGASVYFHFPSLFSDAFPQIEPEVVLQLRVFCRLFAESIFWQDKIIDGNPTDEPTATIAVRIMLMQAEAYQLLHGMFSPQARFWERFRQYLIEHAHAILLERQFVSGERRFFEYTDDVRNQIVVGKNGISRCIIAAFVELARDERLFEPLIAIVNEFNHATQLWDDLEDWKDDLRRGIPTSVVSRLMTALPENASDEHWNKISAHLTRKFYYEGHARVQLSMICSHLDTIDRLARDLPPFRLLEKTRILRRKCNTLDEDIACIVNRHLSRALGASRGPHEFRR